MTNKNSAWCTLMAILGYIIGVVYCFTLILIPIAIYCFIGARRYMEWAELTDSQLAQYKSNLTNWAIFFSIVGFPIGLFSIVPACLVNNNVTITNVQEPTENQPDVAQNQNQTETAKNEHDDIEDCMKTIEKLDSLKKEGLITEEEYERAKKEVLEKNK